MKRFLCILLCVGLCGAFPVSARTFSEEEIDNTPLGAVMTAADGEIMEIKAKSALLIEPVTGQVLYESNADEQTAPASITKIMSLILYMEALERGDFALDTMLSCSETAAALGGSQIWLEPGEQMSVDDLLKAVCIVSANDATVLLAEAVAGSEESFVALMNEKAAALGMNSTHFVNCTGLDAPDHYTTAHDVALMSCELIKHEKITDYSTVWMDSLRGGESVLVNTNKLVRFYEGCIGIKTGTTATAGYCLSAGACRGEMKLVAVVMSAETSADRFAGAQKLLSYGFAHYSFVSLTPEIGAETAEVVRGVKRTVPVAAEKNFDSLLKKSDAAKITQEVEWNEVPSAPLMAGDTLGRVRFLLDGTEIGWVNIVATEDVPRYNFKSAFFAVLGELFSL